VDYLAHGSLSPAGFPYLAPNSRDNYNHTLYVGVEHSLRSDLSVSLHAGATYYDYYNEPPGESVSTWGPYVDASAQYTYMQGGALTLGFRHSRNATDVGFSLGGLVMDQESSSVYGTVEQTLSWLSPKLIAHLSAQYQASRFNGGGFNNDHDTFYLLGVNFTYQFNPHFSAEAGYNYDLLHSDVPGRPYDRNRVYVGVTATY
ncbi:MAG TPA: outer membrane beta-barrel protein, partial [Verrucomicrobiae bacterium]|nr:outer membrane beta-barrel protein [Verrucomicrobiae bacterium]